MDGELERHIRRWRAQRFRSQSVEGTFRFCPAAAAYILAALLADRIWSLPQTARYWIFVAGAAAGAAGLYLYYVRPLFKLKIPRVIRDAVKRYPHIRAYVQSAWELKITGAGVSTSQEMAEEHLRRTEEILKKLPEETVFSAKPSRRAAKRTAAAFAAWGVAMPWLYNGQADLTRVVAPWRDAKLDSMIEVRPGDEGVEWASSVNIYARWRSEHANGPLALYARPQEGQWRALAWDRESGWHMFRMDSLTSVMEYRFGYHELRSRTYRLTPVPYPRLKDLSARVHLPGHGASEKTILLEGSGEVEALRRSWVTVTGMPDSDVTAAVIEVSYLSSPVPMKKTESGSWEGGFPLNEDGTFKIRLESARGFRDPHPVVFNLRALADEKPETELLSPTFELEISRRERLTVTYEASDDFGLRSLSLLYKAGSDPERAIALHVFKKTATEYLGDYSWDISKLPVGSRVTFRIRAVDNARPNPQTSVSNQGIIHIVDFESAHSAAERLWATSEETLRRLSRSESDMAELLKELAETPATPEQAAKLDELRNKASTTESALESQWSRAVRDLKDFSQTMKQDPYANPGMTEASEMLAKAMESLQKYDLKKAREATEAGEFKKGQDMHRKLGEHAKKAGDILSTGREMQSMQDFWGEAHRMDQAGGEISEELDKIAQSGQAPDKEDQEKLQKALGELQKQMDALSKTIQSMPKADPDSERDKNRKIYKLPLNEARRTASSLQDALERGDYKTAARLAKQLARQLSQVREAVAQAAQGASDGGMSQTSARMEAAKKMWDDVVAQQSRSLQMTSALEDGKRSAMSKAQESLLAELAELQSAVVSEAEARPALIPRPTTAAMKTVLEEFKAAKVRESPNLLQNITNSLSYGAIRFPAVDGRPSAEGLVLGDLAVRERKIMEKLAEGAPPPPLSESQLSEVIAAGAVQNQTRRKTEDLAEEISKLSQEVGAVPGEVAEALHSARGEQSAAEGALRDRDSLKAMGHQQKALEYLQQGQKGMDEALQNQQSIARQTTQPFGSPRGVGRPVGGGRSGVERGFVPLPRAEDYQPPYEIRREIERSLQEPRPKVFDETTDEYLKRMSQ